MKAHTNDFKENVKLFGRQIDSKITFQLNGERIELGSEDLNSITLITQGAILKSVMKQLEIDSNVEIPVGTILTCEFGVKIDFEYEYINYRDYIVETVEKMEDTLSYRVICYDKMLYSMKDYVAPQITYPITVREYINVLCNEIGLTFKNVNDEFANFDKVIPGELYQGLGFTYRDVFDQLAEVTASTICLNDDDEVEIRYIKETNDQIDEEYLKDVNVKFGEKYGPVNVIVLSRSAGSDNIYYPEQLPENPLEIRINDNEIMNFDNRSEFLPAIYEKLNGLEYYLNDYTSTGICYYDVCDRYNVKIGEKTYSCVMFNDEINITQGLEEIVYTEKPEQSETDYKKADTTDKKLSKAYIEVDKQNKRIDEVVEIQKTDGATLAEIVIENGSISQRVTKAETSLNDLGETITKVEGTFLEQTNKNFTMWFEKTGVQGTINDLKNLVNNQNTTLDELRAYIRYGVITDTESEFYGSPYAEFGKEDAQTKLRILKDRIQFLTGEVETAYISNNALYINESTILTKQVIGQDGVGKWITEIDEQGNLNTYWGGID